MRTLMFVVFLALGLALSPDPAFSFSRHQTVAVDAGIPPAPAGDATAIVEGCGQQPIVGYTYCRVQEGSAANQSVAFIAPPADCDDNPDSCAFIKVADRSGNIVWGTAFKKGTTRVSVPWSTLLGGPNFSASFEGIWAYQLEVHFLDPDHHVRVSKARGAITLEVFQKGYVPLNHVTGDPNFVWSWVDGGFLYQMTSSLRAFVGKAP